ncbi:LacI family DNA-binding transcriptional regulator [Neptunitalea chrysea]|uniref:LacI family DNA-binding transcriptional regulator n=1 Tax=Neptunitalea chrysea TaxID=1647581 RepID=UPI002493BBF4|nr:LacI family DNA-binding transcriptional regulator [Neptunitalea chrysea]
MKKVSIKDVAKKAGVSIASVSYVLNNRKDSRISEDTIKKVKNAAQELNYRPNKIAKSLKTQRTFTFGLLVADIANPYFSQLARIIEDAAKHIGCTLIIGSCDEDKEKFEDLINTFCDRQVDGLIIAPVANSANFLERIQKQAIPFVLIDRYIPSLRATTIGIDNTEVTFKGTEHLIKNNRKKIAFISYITDLQHLLDREIGFKNALKAHKVPIKNSRLIKVDKDFIDRDIDKNLKQLLTPNPVIDALFFSSNKLAVAGLKTLVKLGIEVPEKIGVLAFDEVEAYKVFKVPVSHIKQPLYEIGVQAVTQLEKMIKDPQTKFQKTTLEASLIVGASS